MMSEVAAFQKDAYLPDHGYVYVMLVHELEFLLPVPVLRKNIEKECEGESGSTHLGSYRTSTQGLALKDAQPFLFHARITSACEDTWEVGARTEERSISRQIDVSVDVDEQPPRSHRRRASKKSEAIKSGNSWRVGDKSRWAYGSEIGLNRVAHEHARGGAGRTS